MWKIKFEYVINWFLNFFLASSVLDPYVFGPPGSASRSVICVYGSGFGSFHNEPKNEEKPWFIPFLLLFYDFLSLKNGVNVPSKRNKHKNLKKKAYFLLASWRTLTKRAGSWSVCQRYGSGTLFARGNCILWLFRQEVSHWRAVAGGERPPARRHQHAARDPAADAPDRPQHHHVRGLSQPVVHVPPPPRAHPAQRGVLPEPSRPNRHVSAAGQARAHDVLVRQSHGGNRTQFVDQESWQVRLIIFWTIFCRVPDPDPVLFFDPWFLIRDGKTRIRDKHHE